MMKRYTVANARRNLAEVLDTAEQGEAVVIERRGVRFNVTPAAAPVRARGPRASRIEYIDPLVESGTWSWEWSPTSGVELQQQEPPAKARRRA